MKNHGLKTKRDDYLIMPIKTDIHPRHLCENDLGQGFVFILNTVEPQYNKGPRDWQNVSAIKKFHYIEVIFHTFYSCWGEENCSLYQRVCYVEVCYIEKVSQ